MMFARAHPGRLEAGLPCLDVGDPHTIGVAIADGARRQATRGTACPGTTAQGRRKQSSAR
jgi:hypothetical protein